uniref:Omega-phylotoxin-To1a n=1 Tax=Tibellus oblongus TaxID=336685 RepID=TBO1_TIBOB|nr:RecName: Full=Omega-phylotoxin-To1a; Short=Omega-PHTX-To1a; AltName: Full=Omega-Tbo-IT1; Flags: Precursor [Tibellus oblongus]AKJ77984.1 Omega-Tbo-IT1 precursor [Tibellus oblongus]
MKKTFCFILILVCIVLKSVNAEEEDNFEESSLEMETARCASKNERCGNALYGTKGPGCCNGKCICRTVPRKGVNSCRCM